MKQLKGPKAKESLSQRENAVEENQGWVRYSTRFGVTLRGDVLHLGRLLNSFRPPGYQLAQGSCNSLNGTLVALKDQC